MVRENKGGERKNREITDVENMGRTNTGQERNLHNVQGPERAQDRLGEKNVSFREQG